MACKRCQEVPNFHSFDYIAEIQGIHYYYCFPAANKQSVRTHEDMLNFIAHFPTDKPWSLLFHSNGYGVQHLMPISVAIEMGKITQEKHRETLQKIYVVEGSVLFQFVLKYILPYCSPELTKKFTLVNGSLLEVITELRKTGLSIKDLHTLRTRFG